MTEAREDKTADKITDQTTDKTVSAQESPSYGEIVWGQFRKYKLSHWALGGVLVLFLIAVYAPLISLDLPLTMQVAGERTYPWVSDLFNRNYFHSTVDIFFNSLMILLPVLWGAWYAVKRWIQKKPWTKRKKDAASVDVLWGCAGVVLLVNIVLYLSPVEHPLSDARTRWDSIQAVKTNREQAEASLASPPLAAGAPALIDHLEATNKAIDAAESALLSVLSDPLRGLSEALPDLKAFPSEESLQTLAARLTKGLRDLEAVAANVGIDADLSPIQSLLVEAQDEAVATDLRVQAIEKALELSQTINKQLPRSQIAADVLATQAESQAFTAQLANIKQDTRKARRATEQLVQSAVAPWAVSAKTRPSVLKRLSDDVDAHQKAIRTWETSALVRGALPEALQKRLQTLKTLEDRLDASAIFPLVSYSFRFPTGDFQKPMPWSKGGMWAHPFGTNNQSKDTFAQMVFGTRIALTIGIVAVAISEILGVVLGALAGYFGGRTDTLIMRLIEIMLCFPSLFMIMSLAALIEDRSIFHVMLIIGLTRWTGPARLVRGEFLRLRNMEFVQAARALGLPEWRIIFQHVLPNALGPVLVSATFGVASAILLESTISFLGVGDPSASTWGKILNEGRLARSEPMILLPGVAIFLIVSLFNLIGEGVRDALDPKMRK